MIEFSARMQPQSAATANAMATRPWDVILATGMGKRCACPIPKVDSRFFNNLAKSVRGRIVTLCASAVGAPPPGFCYDSQWMRSTASYPAR